MKTCLVGSYPKIPAGSGPSVRTAIQRFEAGDISPRALHETYRDVTRRVLALAEAHAVDLTTDGQIRWNDLMDPLTRDVDNFRAAGLLRLFDNNFYYRHPVITGRLQFQGGTLAYWAREAVSLTSVPVMVALPGPYTVLALAEDQSYHHRDRLLADIVEVLRLEAESLVNTGVREVQWDEPGLATHSATPSLEEVASVYGDLTQNPPVPMSVALYWGSSSPWLRAFEGLTLNRLSVDVVHEPPLLRYFAEHGAPYPVGFGVLNAREVRLESVDELTRQLEPVIRRLGEDAVLVHPNSGLELLPPDRAEAKVALLGQLKVTLSGSPHSERGGN
ncbi:MAG: synthase [Firmicutes bacterium]|nr:synthase [Bacillota bacterium]